jgi:hypothetical protein
VVRTGIEALIALILRRARSGGPLATSACVQELADGLAQVPNLGQAPRRRLDTGDPTPLGADPVLELVVAREQVALAGRGDHHGVGQIDRRTHIARVPG